MIQFSSIALSHPHRWLFDQCNDPCKSETLYSIHQSETETLYYVWKEFIKTCLTDFLHLAHTEMWISAFQFLPVVPSDDSIDCQSLEEALFAYSIIFKSTSSSLPSLFCLCFIFMIIIIVTVVFFQALFFFFFFFLFLLSLTESTEHEMRVF